MLTFNSQQSDLKHLSGLAIVQLTRTNPSEHDAEIEVMYDLVLESGHKVQCFSNELHTGSNVSVTHYTLPSLDEISRLLLTSPKAKSFENLSIPTNILDLGGFSIVRFDGLGATILSDEVIEKIINSRVSIHQLDANSSVVDLVIKSPNYDQKDFSIDEQLAYQYALENKQAELSGGHTLSFQEWLDLRRNLVQMLSSNSPIKETNNKHDELIKFLKTEPKTVKIDQASIVMINNLDDIDFKLDDRLASEQVTGFINDQSYLSKLSKLLGFEVKKITRQLCIDIAFESQVNEDGMRTDLTVYQAEDDIDLTNPNDDKHMVASGMGIVISKPNGEETLKLKQVFNYQDEQELNVLDAFTMALGISDIVDETQNLLDQWDGAESAISYRRGYLKAKNIFQ